MPNATLQLATRRTDSNPNHHLWNNNGVWWLHFTLRAVIGKSRKRHRTSIKTRDLDAAQYCCYSDVAEWRTAILAVSESGLPAWTFLREKPSGRQDAYRPRQAGSLSSVFAQLL